MINVYLAKLDVARAVEYAQRAVDAARDPFYAQASRSGLAAALLMAGRRDEAEEESAAVIAFAERYDFGWLAARAYPTRAMVRIARGQVAEGLRDLEALRDSSFENGNMIACISAEQFMGMVYLKMAEGGGPMNLTTVVKNLPFLIRNAPFADSRAQKHLGEAIKLSQEIGAKLQLGRAYLSLGLLHRAKKRKEKAKECLTEAVQLLAECQADGPLREATEALELLGVAPGAPRRP